MSNINESISQVFLLIDSALYQAVSWLYNLFLKLAQAEIFTSDIYENFAQRVYIVLGVVMLFVLAYGLLQAIVNPDNFTKGDKSFSKVAKNLVVALIIIGLLPTVFDYSRKLQNFILDSNLIGTLLFGGSDMDVEVCDDSGNCKVQTLSSSEVAKAKVDTYGNVMALTTLNAFLNPQNINFEFDASSYLPNHGLVNPFSVIGCGIGVVGGIGITIVTGGTIGIPTISGLAVVCKGLGSAGNFVANHVMDVKHYTWNDIRVSILTEQNGGFTQIISIANAFRKGAKDENGNSVRISYLPFVSSACACLIIYLLITFCLDLGVRTVRLAFLQLIAPIPVFMKAMPNKGSQFDKWLKKTIATYFEVFIRVFLMYMVVYFLSNLKIDLNTREGLWITVVIIMGLIAFVREAPKLISDIIGIDSGNMKLGIMPKLAAGGALAAASLAGSGVTALTRNLVHGGKNAYEAFKDTNTGGLNKAWNVAKAAGTGVGSGLLGGLSGSVRGLYAGRGAKNIADVRKSASAGAKGATDARDRREAYRLAHRGNVGGAQIWDKLQGAWEWAGGGFEAEEAKIKYYSDLKSASDKVKAETKDILSKNMSNSKIVEANMNYKGVSDNHAQAFKNMFAGKSMGTIKNMIADMKQHGVAKENFMHTDASGHEYLDEAAYNAARLEFNSFMDASDSMYNQLEKETIKKIQSMAFNNDSKNLIDVAPEKMEELRNRLKQASNMMSAHGDAALDFESAYNSTVDGAGKAQVSGLGIAYDEVMDDYSMKLSKLEAEVTKKKAERAARQNNNGGNK